MMTDDLDNDVSMTYHQLLMNQPGIAIWSLPLCCAQKTWFALPTECSCFERASTSMIARLLSQHAGECFIALTKRVTLIFIFRLKPFSRATCFFCIHSECCFWVGRSLLLHSCSRYVEPEAAGGLKMLSLLCPLNLRCQDRQLRCAHRAKCLAHEKCSPYST